MEELLGQEQTYTVTYMTDPYGTFEQVNTILVKSESADTVEDELEQILGDYGLERSDIEAVLKDELYFVRNCADIDVK